MSESDNYYEELGVEPGASRDDIREAHRQRVADLEAAREKKGVTESQLQANRDEVARVRAAWNVLSDPFQRQRYDAQLASDSEPGSEVEIVDDDSGTPQQGGQPLTGWRKLLAPPPPKQAGSGAGNRNGNGSTAQSNRRPRPEPTVVLPAGMTIAEPRARGMALLFDLSILIVIFFAASYLIPQLMKPDYVDIQDRVAKIGDLKDARDSLSDAQKSVDQAKTANETKSAQQDLKSAQKDYTKAQKDAKDAGVPASRLDDSSKQLQKYSDKLTDDIKPTGYVIAGTTIVLALLYLVPRAALKGYTFGMRNRGVRLVRVDGAPVGWYGAFTHFALPVIIAVALNPVGLGGILGLGMVAWGYFDRNGQGIHDKLARTLVVAA
jgi:uncharacterized RDD family membrane protein YckC